MSKEVVAGVAALIVVPQTDSFLAIRELISSERTIKLAGMFSPPMESAIVGESSEQTLVRLFQEEVSFPSAARFRFYGQLCRLKYPGFIVDGFVFLSDEEYLVQEGTTKDEVERPVWKPLSVVERSPIGNFDFRPGARELIQAYRTRTTNGERNVAIPELELADAPAILEHLYRRNITDPSGQLTFRPVPAG